MKFIREFIVAGIFDDFTYQCLKYEFNKLIKITPNNWKDEITNNKVELLFIESAWNGNNGKWSNMIGVNKNRDDKVLAEVVKFCQSKNIKTFFWNKEDPIHFNTFIKTALKFDYILTTDANSIPNYKKHGHKSVHPMPFACQPKIHNPISSEKIINKPFYSGTYYSDRFPERTKVFDKLLDVAIKYDLDIYDRNFNNTMAEKYKFPSKYKSYIKGYIPPDQIHNTYKKYKIAINVNTITNSSTMCSRRVFEILGCGTPIVSGPSLALNKYFKGLVVATDNMTVIENEIKRLLTDDKYYLEKRKKILATILKEHTYERRFENIFIKCGIKYIINNKI